VAVAQAGGEKSEEKHRHNGSKRSWTGGNKQKPGKDNPCQRAACVHRSQRACQNAESNRNRKRQPEALRDSGFSSGRNPGNRK
jgi:hypothetical protein